MKFLKVFKRKKKSITNNFQVDPQSKMIWELLEENAKLKKKLEEKNGKGSKGL